MTDLFSSGSLWKVKFCKQENLAKCNKYLFRGNHRVKRRWIQESVQCNIYFSFNIIQAIIFLCFSVVIIWTCLLSRTLCEDKKWLALRGNEILSLSEGTTWITVTCCISIVPVNLFQIFLAWNIAMVTGLVNRSVTHFFATTNSTVLIDRMRPIAENWNE